MGRLEGRAGFRPDQPDGDGSEGAALASEADAARELDREIADLRREIEAAEARMTPDELASWRAEWAQVEAALAERTRGLELSDELVVLRAEIAKVEGGEG